MIKNWVMQSANHKNIFILLRYSLLNDSQNIQKFKGHNAV